MTTTPAGCENAMLKRGLLALAAAFPAEFTANSRAIVRGRLRDGYEVLEDRINNSDACKMRNHQNRQLAADRAMLRTLQNPEQAATIRAKVKVLEGDIERIDRFLNQLRKRAADGERSCILNACEKIRVASLDVMLELLNSEEFSNALAMYLSAETDLAVCGSNVDEFVANRAAMLADGD